MVSFAFGETSVRKDQDPGNGREVLALDSFGTGGAPVAARPQARVHTRRESGRLARRNRVLEEDFAALEREYRELQQTLYDAAQAQRKLCSPREHLQGSFEIASEIFPARHLSGDFCTVLERDGEITLVVGDIVGKGLQAGLWLTYLVGMVRVFAGSFPDLRESVTALNRELYRLNTDRPVAGVFLARLDPGLGELIYCNAGLPPALVLRREGIEEALEVGGPPLGILPNAAFDSGRVVLEPGDTLISYSDGVIECSNTRDEEFGTERVVAAARRAPSPAAGAMLFSILAAVQDFANGGPQADDMTVMVVRCLDSDRRPRVVALPRVAAQIA